MSHIFIQASWHYRIEGDWIVFASALYNSRFRVKRRSQDDIAAAVKLLRNGVLDTTAVTELAAAARCSVDDAERLLGVLRERGVLVSRDALNDTSEPDEYDRQRRFFRQFESSECSGTEYDGRIRRARIVVVGLGGYGTWLALLCSRIGIGTVVGIDHDVVERTNLSRQILYSGADIGRSKVECCRQALAGTGRSTFEGIEKKIRTPSDLMPALDGADLVFNPFGYLPRQEAQSSVLGYVVEAAMAMKVPCLTFGGSWLGPLTVPNRTPCYYCLLSGTFRDQLEESMTLSRPARAEEPGPAFAPRLGLSASAATWEASRFIAGILDSPVLNAVVMLDTLRYAQHSIVPIARSNECPLCA